MTDQDFQQRVLAQLERLDQLDTLTTEVRATNERLDQTNERLDQTNERLDQLEQNLKDEVQRWDNRFFEFTRNELSMTRTIIITAGAAVIFVPLLRELAPAIVAFLNGSSNS
ncbi:MAG: hypothetical protein ACPGVO_06200 [Spirulinaceae cyanobacterium]